jgi:hypothetical protein
MKLIIFMTQFGFDSHNGLTLLGNIALIGLLFRQTFSNLFKPTKTFLFIETILLDSSHNSLRFNK